MHCSIKCKTTVAFPACQSASLHAKPPCKANLKWSHAQACFVTPGTAKGATADQARNLPTVAPSSGAEGPDQELCLPLSWQALKEHLLTHGTRVQSPLPLLMHAWAMGGHPSQSQPTQLLLSRLLPSAPELAALQHLLSSPSPWKPLHPAKHSQGEQAR